LKIKLYHTVCGREILVRQVLQTGGHCPWDGKPFNKDYTAVIAEALETAESAGNVLENAFEKIDGMDPSFTIDPASVLGEIQGYIEALNRRQRGEGGRR
jgi:hypothetical protein